MRFRHPDAGPIREFHVARTARDRYQFDQPLFAFNGNVIFANFHAARVFAQKMNAKRDLARFPEQAVRAAQINAMGLVDELQHLVVEQYRTLVNPDAMERALAHLADRCGAADVETALRRFTDGFPPLAVHRRDSSVDEYLAGETGGMAHRQVALEELLMLWLENVNPAFAPYGELFDDTGLKRDTVYPRMVEELRSFFDREPRFGPDNLSLIDMLRAPALASPHSLAGQLEYIRTRWFSLLGPRLYRVLGSLDFIREEEKPIFFGPGPSQVPTYALSTGTTEEPERFSMDLDWMPRAVLIAKNAYVWLDQLSKSYGCNIARLDQIPDEELDTLARRGFTGLWLIGVWERSRASQRIKQMCGNPDAVASAYSLAHYGVAEDLGGADALHNLRERAAARGIRLASDMVPNHMGIDSEWVIRHPDWFVALDYSPFPAYSFNGPDLSQDERVGLFLEDHYYSRSDAAVVFKRVDRWTGQERYVYHGNDGTNMPWNDTAQLDFRNAEVREAIIQTILHVARNFPIIRFDAAMTLAKKHYQRLWFPEPGAGGAIPSRAEHAMTRAQFDEAMPEEFWREVVDRVAKEAPDTLLLAEAFWMMEGYFVRTLGMHRVYNSAFMNMLRDEENAKYRWVMKNTLEFDPEILKRFVNFLNNPDEHTAIEQFGTGDKYFGICLLMCTLPGLPMFGHGQIEGFAEKYGMEYRRAYWDEKPDEPLVAHHERVIFPILHRRRIFADVANFLLYDFWSPDGAVDDNVFAYSNRHGDASGLIVFHNRFGETRGWVRTSAGYAVKEPDGGKTVVQRTLGEGLSLSGEEGRFVVFRDHVSGLEYLHRSKDLCERGLYLELGAYRYRAFLDFREVADNEWGHYAELERYLGGRGVPSLDEAMREVLLSPVHRSFRELTNAGFVRHLLGNRAPGDGTQVAAEVMSEVGERVTALLTDVRDFTASTLDVPPLATAILARWDAALTIGGHPDSEATDFIRDGLGDDEAVWGTLCGWLALHALGKVAGADAFEATSRSWIDELRLSRVLSASLMDLGMDEAAADYRVALVRVLTAYQRWAESLTAGADGRTLAASLFADSDVQRILNVNRHQGALWYNREALEDLLWWMVVVAWLADRDDAVLADAYRVAQELSAASDEAGYRVDRLL